MVGGHSYQISYTGGDGNDVTLTRLADPTPPAPTPPGPSAPGETYLFSSASQADASGYTANDGLVFTSGSASDVTVVAAANGGITLTEGGKSLTFAPALSTASLNQQIAFTDGSHLLIGANGGNSSVSLSGTASYYVYGLNGADTITLGDGNNHVWGNAPGTQGQTDGADVITLSGGTNYVNGNAGNDTIMVGTSGSTGSNRVLGGAGDDMITLAGAGHNSVNGNMGNDTVDASSATGDNLLRGGQGNDLIRAGHGHDQLLGDMGADTLVAGTGTDHITLMTGGNDGSADLFMFKGAQSSANVNGQTYTQEVTDYAHGIDHLALGFQPVTVYSDGTTYGDMGSAQAAAQNWLNSHAGANVVAEQVGQDSYLFYNAAGSASAIDSMVKLDHVTASSLGTGDFINAAG